MEGSERPLVPQWLRTAGSVTGSGSSLSLFASSSSSNPDVHSSAHHSKNRNCKSTTDFESSRPAILDRASSTNSRRVSSYGSAKHAYSNFGRSNRDKDREREKERSTFPDAWDRDGSDSLGSNSNRTEIALRRSQSMVSRKQNDTLSRRVPGDSKNSSGNYQSNGNSLLSAVKNSSIPKTIFEKDFPSLGVEDKQGVPDIGRVSSPGLSVTVHSLPLGNATMIGGEGWTSALAEVPTIIGSNDTCIAPAVQSPTVGCVTAALIPAAGMNMAGALQTSSRAHTPPQLSVQTQRLEELAIKQSRQLIPVTPSMPKALSSSDKSKAKSLGRTGEMIATAKNGSHQISSLHHANHPSLHGGHVKSDSPKTSQGKLLVLKPGWENGLSSSTKDTSLANNVNGRVVNSQTASPPSVGSSASLRSMNNIKPSTGERKSTPMNLTSGLSVEKRPSLAQTQSRNAFFDRLKKKTDVTPKASADLSSVDSPIVVSPPTEEKSGASSFEVGSTSATPCATNTDARVSSNGDNREEKSMNPDEVPDPKEYAFLRSLGWEESSGEDEGLTQDEINAFVNQYKELIPSLELRRAVLPEKPESSDSGSKD